MVLMRTTTAPAASPVSRRTLLVGDLGLDIGSRRPGTIYPVSAWPGWRNGRRRGLKPLGRATSVRVRIPLRARSSTGPNMEAHVERTRDLVAQRSPADLRRPGTSDEPARSARPAGAEGFAVLPAAIRALTRRIRPARALGRSHLLLGRRRCTPRPRTCGARLLPNRRGSGSCRLQPSS